MNTQIVLVEKEIQKIEESLFDKATIIQNTDQLLSFYFVYLSHYLPILEYAIEYLPEDSLAKIANFGMLIDHLISVKINSVIDLKINDEVCELSERLKKPKTEIAKYFKDLSTSQKIQIASSVLLSSSLTRDFNLTCANSKFNAINKIKIWENLFQQLIDYPALIDSFISKEQINDANHDLEFAKKRIQNKDRSYDYDLTTQWQEITGFTRQKLITVPKFFVGSKIAWLQAKKGLELARCILDKDLKAGENAQLYNDHLISCLENKNVSKNEWAYRNFSSTGPSCDIKNIIDSNISVGEAYLIPADSHTIFVQSSQGIFFLEVSGIFGLYVNPKMKVLINNKYEVPISQDIAAIKAFYDSPSKFIINNIKYLSKPSDSNFYNSLLKDREIINKIIQNVDSFTTKLSITFNGKINKKIANSVSKFTEKGFEGILIYGTIYGLEKIAQSAGLQIESELWSQTRLTITGIIMAALKPVSKKVDDLKKDDQQVNNQTDDIITSFEDKVKKIYQKIEESDKAFNDTFNELNESGLTSLFDLTKNVKEILLSGLSLEEINDELKKYFTSIESGKNYSAQHAV